MDTQNVVELFGPEKELQRIIYSNYKDKTERALKFFMNETRIFLDLKHMIELFDTEDEFQLNLPEMVKAACNLRRKTLKALPEQFRLLSFSKRFYSKKLVSIVENHHKR